MHSARCFVSRSSGGCGGLPHSGRCAAPRQATGEAHSLMPDKISDSESESAWGQWRGTNTERADKPEAEEVDRQKVLSVSLPPQRTAPPQRVPAQARVVRRQDKGKGKGKEAQRTVVKRIRITSETRIAPPPLPRHKLPVATPKAASGPLPPVKGPTQKELRSQYLQMCSELDLPPGEV